MTSRRQGNDEISDQDRGVIALFAFTILLIIVAQKSPDTTDGVRISRDVLPPNFKVASQSGEAVAIWGDDACGDITPGSSCIDIAARQSQVTVHFLTPDGKIATRQWQIDRHHDAKNKLATYLYPDFTGIRW